MSNLNHMICPTCGHDFYVEAAYGTCDACQTMFYAGQSRTCQSSGKVQPLQPNASFQQVKDWSGGDQ